MKKQLPVPVVLGLVVITGAAAFFGGMQYQKTKRFSGEFQRSGIEGGNRMMGTRSDGSGRMMQGFKPVSGEIISTDQSSVTVKLEDGSSKIVMFSDNTQINKAEKVEKSNLAVGEKISVFGSEKDGVVTATMIQLGDMPMGGKIQMTMPTPSPMN